MNIPSIFRKTAPPAPAQDITAIAREAALEAVRVDVLPHLQRIAESGELARRSTPNVITYGNHNGITPGAYGMNDPRRFRDYTDPRYRPYSLVNVDTLRVLARTYDVLADCIAHLKDQVIRTGLKVAPKDDKDKSASTAKQAKEAEAFLMKSGGLGGWGVSREDFEGRLLDDLIVIGAGAVYFSFDTVGSYSALNPDSCIAIDSSTIRPLITAYGFAPSNTDPAFEQVVQGAVTGRYSRAELIYSGLPIFAQSYSPYYLSAVEQIVGVVMTALKSDEWNRVWLTDGNVPDRLIQVPPEWTPDQIMEYATYFDSLLSGDSRERRKARFVPSGTTMSEQSRKEADFQEFEFWLRDRTCAMMGVNPASIGFHSRQYKDSQEGAMDSTRDNRVSTLLAWRRSLYNDILERKGLDAVHVTDEESDSEEAKARADRHQIEIQSGIRTINETRQEDGLDPSSEEGADKLLVLSTLTTLDKVAAPAPEPVITPAVPAVDGKGTDTSDGKPEAPAENPDALGRALRQWETKCLNRLKRGQSVSCSFSDEALPGWVAACVGDGLTLAETKEDVKQVFARMEGTMTNEDTEKPKGVTGVEFTDAELDALTDDLGADDIKMALAKATPEKRALLNAEQVDAE